MEAEATVQRVNDFHRIYPDGSPDTIRLSGNRIEVSDCDILGSGHSLRLFKATNVIVARNILTNGRYGSYSIVGSRQVVFEGNTVTAADLQGTGGGISTLSKWVSASENIFVGGNTFKAIYGWDREAMTSDGPGGYYFGHAENSGPDRLSLPDAANPYPSGTDWTGAAVMVVNGRGAGQYARVKAFEKKPSASSVVLDRPLEVALDRESEITITQAQQNYLIIDNDFEDTGVAAQTYGTALGHVIAKPIDPTGPAALPCSDCPTLVSSPAGGFRFSAITYSRATSTGQDRSGASSPMRLQFSSRRTRPKRLLGGRQWCRR